MIIPIYNSLPGGLTSEGKSKEFEQNSILFPPLSGMQKFDHMCEKGDGGGAGLFERVSIITEV